MNSLEHINQSNVILTGVLLFEDSSDIPKEVLNSGEFIAAEEFYEAVDIIGRGKEQATRTLRSVLSIIGHYKSSDPRASENVLAALDRYSFWRESTLDKDFFKNVLISTQVLVDLHEEIEDGQRYAGFGPGCMEVLGSLLFEIETISEPQ